MGGLKLTQEEAELLLRMTKSSLESEINFPPMGKTEEFDVIGDAKTDIFTINLFRGKINRSKYNMSARIKKNGILLLELHINPSNVHHNPDGEKILGSHWHIYSEEHGRSWAFVAVDFKDDSFIENTILFLKRFNVIKRPDIHYQLELI